MVNLWTHSQAYRFPVARNLREGLSRGQGGLFQASVYIGHPEQEIRHAVLELADLSAEFAQLLCDQPVVLQEDVLVYAAPGRL